MLQRLRSSTASIFAKMILGLLILSFGAWGIQGYISGGVLTDAVVKIGEQDISAQEVKDAFGREVRTLQQRGLDITVEQARGLGLLDQALNRLIDGRIFALGGDSLGMVVSDSTVRGAIRDDPLFRNESGEFDKSRFDFLLRQSGLTEAALVADIRRDLFRRQLLNSMDFSGEAPVALVAALHAWREERRVAEMMVVKVDETLDVGEPDDAALEKLHQDNARDFTAPERRTVSYVHLAIDDFAQKTVVTDETVRARYQENIGKYTKPEKRIIQYIRFGDESAANSGSEALDSGQSFEDVARDFSGQEGEDLTFGEFAPGEIMIPAIAGAVDPLARGEISQPVDTGFGWNIFRYSGVVPEEVTPFEDLRDELREEVQRDEAADALYRASRDLEDSLGGGGALEDAAATLGIGLRRAGPMDASGLDSAGNPVADLPSGEFLRTAFSGAAGEDSQLTDTADSGYFILRVDVIAPSALRRLAEIRDEVVARWKSERRYDAARLRALGFVDRIESGAPIEEIAAAEGLETVTSKPLNRRGQGDESGLVSPVLAAELFRVRTGQAAFSEGPDRFTVAVLKEIVRADPAATGELGKLLSANMMSDVLIQYKSALREQFGVEVDQNAINRLF